MLILIKKSGNWLQDLDIPIKVIKTDTNISRFYTVELNWRAK